MERFYTVYLKHTLKACIGSLFLIAGSASAQTTYTWNVPNGSWTSPTSWTPARNTPAATDILVFNGSVVPFDTVTNFSKDNVGRLRIINNAQVLISTVVPTAGIGTVSRVTTNVTGSGTQFNSQLIVGDVIYTGVGNGIAEVQTIIDDSTLIGTASNTATAVAFSIYPRLTITGGAQPNLDIQSGSSITFNVANPNGATIYLGSGAKADIRGSVNLINGRSRFLAADSNAIVFKAGSTLNITGTYAAASFPLGSVGPRNVVTFDSGSTYYTNLSVAPFGLTPPESKVLFVKGSTYRHENAGLPSNLFNGRTFSLFILNASAFNNNAVPINFPCTIDSLVIQSATELGFNSSSAGVLNIKRSMVINSGIFSFGTGTAAQTLNFNGTSGLQVIGGSGGSTVIGSNAVVTVNNPAGIRIDRAKLQIQGTLNMVQGNISLNNDSLMLGASGSIPGVLNYTSGHINGQGSFTRWFGTTNTITMAGDSGRFPLAADTMNRHLWISGRPTTAGSVTVTHNDASGKTYFTTPFSDNAGNNVTVNVRSNSNWVIASAGGFAGSGFGLKVQNTTSGVGVTNPINLRLTLATGAAPGTAGDGTGTNASPQMMRTGLTAANLNGTFYVGGDSAQNPLPVKLIILSATATDQQNAVVMWQTAAEFNSDRFEVEKSTDGLVFEKVSTVKALTHSASSSSYSITDAQAFSQNDLVYYRLKIIDNDGYFEYSKVVSARKAHIATIDIIKAMPNPTVSDINLHIFAANDQPVKVEVVDIKGSVYYSADTKLQKGANEINVNMNPMDKGIYFIRLTGNSEVKHFRILKN